MSKKILEIDNLPEQLRSELFGHYICIQQKIRLELDLLGIRLCGLEFADDNYWLGFGFGDRGDVEQFLKLVDGAKYPSDVGWEVTEEDDPRNVWDEVWGDVALWMPRMDAPVVLTMLHRLTLVMASDEQRLKKINEHEQNIGKKMEQWGRRLENGVSWC